jgi:hypothetical protein
MARARLPCHLPTPTLWLQWLPCTHVLEDFVAAVLPCTHVLEDLVAAVLPCTHVLEELERCLMLSLQGQHLCQQQLESVQLGPLDPVLPNKRSITPSHHHTISWGQWIQFCHNGKKHHTITPAAGYRGHTMRSVLNTPSHHQLGPVDPILPQRKETSHQHTIS